jgi:futalosine hydrolase
VVQRLSPDVESMEGAAFAYACALSAVPYAQVRAISNLVERRNRDAWRMDLAVRNLNRAALRILDHACA